MARRKGLDGTAADGRRSPAAAEAGRARIDASRSHLLERLPRPVAGLRPVPASLRSSRGLMPAYYMVPCSCGRQLRAEEKQVGLMLRCWGCGAEVVVPRPRGHVRLVGGVWNATRDTFQAE